MAHDSTQRPALLMTGPYQPWGRCLAVQRL